MATLKDFKLLRVIELTDKMNRNNTDRGYIIYCRPLVAYISKIKKPLCIDKYQERLIQMTTTDKNIHIKDVLDELIFQSIDNSMVFDYKIRYKSIVKNVNDRDLCLYTNGTKNAINFTISFKTFSFDCCSELPKTNSSYIFKLDFYADRCNSNIFNNMFLYAEYNEKDSEKIRKLIKDNCSFIPYN